MKEFPNKDDALHWLDVLKSLSNKNLLKGQFDLMKSAAANRKATQEAYEKILNSKQVFVPEENETFVKDPSKGADCWGEMFKKYKPPEAPAFPESCIRIPSSCLEKMKLVGFEKPIVGELFGWNHQQLGWRVNLVLTHAGDSVAFEDVAEISSDPHCAAHLGFIRCGFEEPDLTHYDKTRLREISDKHPAIAVVVSYPATNLVSNPLYPVFVFALVHP